MRNEAVQNLVSLIQSEEARIKEEAKQERLNLINTIINEIVTSVDYSIRNNMGQHEFIYSIEPRGVHIICDNDTKYRLDTMTLCENSSMLFDIMPSVIEEFPKKYFTFFKLYANDNLDADIKAEFSKNLLKVANGTETDKNLIKAFTEPDFDPAKNTDKVHFFLAVHYCEKTKVDSYDDETNEEGMNDPSNSSDEISGS